MGCPDKAFVSNFITVLRRPSSLGLVSHHWHQWPVCKVKITCKQSTARNNQSTNNNRSEEKVPGRSFHIAPFSLYRVSPLGFYFSLYRVSPLGLVEGTYSRKMHLFDDLSAQHNSDKQGSGILVM